MPLPGGAAGGGAASVYVFDLHGLHPGEAAEVALSALDAAALDAAGRGEVWVALLTGARHHSQRLGKGGGSLVALLHEALDEDGADWHLVGDAGGVTAVRVA